MEKEDYTVFEPVVTQKTTTIEEETKEERGTWSFLRVRGERVGRS